MFLALDILNLFMNSISYRTLVAMATERLVKIAMYISFDTDSTVLVGLYQNCKNNVHGVNIGPGSRVFIICKN